LPTPTIILDATGKPEIYERLFGVRPLVYAPTMRLQNRVTQVYSTSGSYASLRQALFRRHMLELVRKTAEEEPRTLVICKQALERHLRLLLPADAGIAHFYGHRGSNAYQDFQRVVIFGMPGMTPETILRYSGALFWTEQLSTETEFVVRRYAGNDVGVQVLVYKEPLIQAVVETAREDEVLQAVHRIRPGLNGDKDIFLFTNLVVPELPVSRLVSVNELKGDRRHAGRERRLALLTKLATQQFERLGFVCPARTLWPVVGKEAVPSETAVYLTGHGVWIQAPPGDRLGRSAFYDQAPAVREACGLGRFELTARFASGRSSVEVWGRDAGCLAAACRFFADHPAHRSEILEIREV
jgi:hypothetical protein